MDAQHREQSEPLVAVENSERCHPKLAAHWSARQAIAESSITNRSPLYLKPDRIINSTKERCVLLFPISTGIVLDAWPLTCRFYSGEVCPVC